MRIAPALIAAAVFATPAAAFDVTQMSESERRAFHAEVRAYILEHPEIIIEAVELLEERHAASEAADESALIAANAETIFRDEHSWVGGNPDGDVTLVEFADYRCGFCQRAHGEIAELLERDDELRFVVKEMPVLGPESELAARFAIAVLQVAGDQAYEAVHDALMTFQGQITEDMLLGLADNMGLATDTIAERMHGDAVGEIIDENLALAQRLQIRGTPTFVLEGEMLRGYLPRDALEMRVAAARGE